MQWTIENMWALHIRPDSTLLSNSYQMEYRPVKYERPTYFQLSIAYADKLYLPQSAVESMNMDGTIKRGYEDTFAIWRKCERTNTASVLIKRCCTLPCH
jgi:hypothetical protein